MQGDNKELPGITGGDTPQRKFRQERAALTAKVAKKKQKVKALFSADLVRYCKNHCGRLEGSKETQNAQATSDKWRHLSCFLNETPTPEENDRKTGL